MSDKTQVDPVEAVARALHVALCHTMPPDLAPDMDAPGVLAELRKLAVAFQATAREQGCAIVPLEPTPAMVEAGARSLCGEYDALPERATYLQRKSATGHHHDRDDARDDAKLAYAAMLAASQPQQQEG